MTFDQHSTKHPQIADPGATQLAFDGHFVHGCAGYAEDGGGLSKRHKVRYVAIARRSSHGPDNTDQG